jgi:hypothetical protein
MFGLPSAPMIKAAFAKYEAAKASIDKTSLTDPQWQANTVENIAQFIEDCAAAFPKQQVKLGKQAPRLDPRTLKLERYTVALPPPPVAVCNSRGITNFGMFMNNEIGDCTCAAVAHAHQAWVLSQIDQGVKNIQPIMPSNGMVLDIYERWCGYSPDDPSTDQGGVELDILRNWKKEGFDSRTILAYAAINPQDPISVKQALNLFGCAYIGVELPVSAQDQKIWDVVSGPDGDPGSWGGHAIVLVDYDAAGLTCVTWGQLQRMSWAWLQKYCDEAYAIISADFRSPQGFDKEALAADLAAVSG